MIIVECDTRCPLRLPHICNGPLKNLTFLDSSADRPPAAAAAEAAAGGGWGGGSRSEGVEGGGSAGAGKGEGGGVTLLGGGGGSAGAQRPLRVLKVSIPVCLVVAAAGQYVC